MYNLSKLSDALNELMILRGLTVQSLAAKTGIPMSCISLYARGLQAPYYDGLIKLANFFNCSTDYLLGLTDNFTEKIYKPCPPFKERLDFLLKEHNFSSYKVYSSPEMSKSSFYEWKRGASLPTVDNLVRLSEIFERSVDYVLGRE